MLPAALCAPVARIVCARRTGRDGALGAVLCGNVVGEAGSSN